MAKTGKISGKIGKKTVSLPVYIEESGASDGEGLGYGRCGIHDEGVFHPTVTALANFCGWDMSLLPRHAAHGDEMIV